MSIKDQDNAFDILIEKKMEIKQLEDQLKKLAPIPEGYESAEEFKQSLTETRKSYEEGQQAYSNLKEEYYENQNNLPETTYEELKAAYVEAKSTFDKKLKRAKSLSQYKRPSKRPKRR